MKSKVSPSRTPEQIQFMELVYAIQMEVDKIKDTTKRYEAEKYAIAFIEGRTPYDYAMKDIKGLQS